VPITEFFSMTPKFKEFLILDLIDRNKKITQRKISKEISVSVSMVNQYLESYTEEGFLSKEYKSSKTVKYFLTDKGKERKRVLNIGYLSAAQKIYTQAKEEILEFLKSVSNKGFKKLIFYGAGEVAEIFLQTINDNNKLNIDVVGVIDDDLLKQDKKICGFKIESSSILNNKKHDGVLVSSYTNNETIHNKLFELKYPKEKIIYFFGQYNEEV